MSKLIKFFIICLIVFVVGLGLCIGGLKAGGVDGLDKVAEANDWLQGNSGDWKTEQVEAEDFDSVKVTGQMDLVLIGDKYMNDEADWALPDKLTEMIRENMPEEGTVIICHGENIDVPEYKTENGVLKIDAGSAYGGVISMDFSADGGIPKAVVFCGDRKLKNVETSNNYCDVTLLGVAFEHGKISNSCGDIFMECVESQGLEIDSDEADASLHGDFYGLTDVKLKNGDVTIETGQNKDTYALNIKAVGGDVDLDNGEIQVNEDPWSYIKDGGPNTININNTSSDVKIFFGDTLY